MRAARVPETVPEISPELPTGAPEDANAAGLPESPCGKVEPHTQHFYTFTTGFYLTGFHCPGIQAEPEVKPDFVTQQQLARVHDAWWDFWISDSDWHRTVHQMIGVVLAAQSVLIVWLALKVFGT